MLEYNFNKLDDDFITLWSRFLLSYDACQIGNDIEKLAELGQINAIQSYYLFLIYAGKTQTNSIIDKKVDENLYSKNFNHLLAIARRNLTTNPHEIELLTEMMSIYKSDEVEIVRIKKTLSRYASNIFSNNEEKEEKQRLKNDLRLLEQRRDYAIDNIASTKFWANQYDAIDACRSQVQLTKDAVVHERLLEMLSSLATAIAGGCDKSRQFKNQARTVRKELIKRCKTTSSSQIDFSLAKNFIFFADKDRDCELGRQILADLARRPLSKTLTGYMLKNQATLTSGENAQTSDTITREL